MQQSETVGPMEMLGPLQTDVMNLIWLKGPMTVQQVMEALNQNRRPLAYTTYLTVMRNMARRRFLSQTPSSTGQRAHVFASIVIEGAYKLLVVEALLAGLFKGDAAAFQRAVGYAVERAPVAKAS